MEKVMICALLLLNLIFAGKWAEERMKFTILIYYIAEKGYKEPTREEMERYIKVVVENKVNDLFKKRQEQRKQDRGVKKDGRSN